jgi:hypothetical protein
LRYIDLSLILGDPHARPAIEAAERARADVSAEPDPVRRKELVARHQPTWVAFREHFERIYGEKCWYTESVNAGNDDDVDHFRPKGRVQEDDTHGGYWWEALNWRNLRLSCPRANRLRRNAEAGETHGKGDHFPLIDDAERWRDPALPCRERPLLLDPTKPRDPTFITFDINGKVALAPRYENDAVARARFIASRKYLHLDWRSIRGQRQLLHADIVKRIDDGVMARQALGRGDPGARDSLDRIIGSLIALTDDRQPYSKAAQAYIRRYRFHDWIEDEVLPHILPTEPAIDGLAA